MKRAIEVLIDGKRVGLLQGRGGKSVGINVGNIPKDHMRVWANSNDDEESWYWQMPDVQDGQTVSFRIIEAEEHEISKPYQKEKRDPEEVAKSKMEARKLFKKAMKEKAEREKGKNA